MKKISIIIFISLTLLFSSCAKTRVVTDRTAPPDPPLLPVEVINGTISGEDLANLLENHMRLWEFIGVLKKKGFTFAQIQKYLNKYFVSRNVPQLTQNKIILMLNKKDK